MFDLVDVSHSNIKLMNMQEFLNSFLCVIYTFNVIDQISYIYIQINQPQYEYFDRIICKSKTLILGLATKFYQILCMACRKECFSYVVQNH